MNDERLYNLLPEIYRVRDVEQGEPLRALLAVLESQLDAIETDFSALYDNWFIETCDEWVVPYIADLLGVKGISGDIALPFSQRSLVAHTIGYRRWRGTPATLEHAARDATGWPATAVEFFDRLAATQSLRYPRPGKGGTVDLREVGDEGPVGAPFETSAHTVVLDSGNGHASQPAVSALHQYSIPKLGLFFWRLRSYPVLRGTAREVQPGCFTFHPFGLDVPLFNRPRRQTSTTSRITEENVPGRLRRRPLIDEIQTRQCGGVPRTDYFGEQAVFEVFVPSANDKQLMAIPSTQIVISDLANWRRPPPSAAGLPLEVAVDPLRGRLALPEGVDARNVEVSYAFGFSTDIGGGPYNRGQTLVTDEPDVWLAVVGRDSLAEHDDRLRFDELSDAIDAWAASGRSGIIQIVDNRTYDLHAPGGEDEEGFAIPLSTPRYLAIEAANERCPCLRGDLNVQSEHPQARLTLNGLWLDGAITLHGSVQLRIAHCTLRPIGWGPTARPSLLANGDASEIQVAISSSIVGPIRLSSHILGLRIEDSIVDGLSGYAIAGHGNGDTIGPMAVVERTTVLGPVDLDALLAAVDVVFDGRVDVRRRQTGIVRYSYLPDDSQTPRRHQCQPDLALANADATTRELIRHRLKPSFTSLVYGEPGYAQLSLACPIEIRAGSEEGSEMGAFNLLHAPWREARLRTVVDEYLPYNLQMGIVYCT